MDAQYRWLIRRDMDACLEIEKLTRKNPLDEEGFMQFMRTRNCIGKIVQNKEEKVIAFSIVFMMPGKLEIARLSVHPDFQRKGIGSMILNQFKDKLSPQHKRRIEIAVSEYNDKGIAFLTTQEFKAVGIEKDLEGNNLYVFRYNLLTEKGWETKNRIASYLEL